MTTQLDTALLTLEQAAYKWCPEARSFLADDGCDNGVTLNRQMDGRPNLGSRCLGERCMFWRWHDAGDRLGEQLLITGAILGPDESLTDTTPPDDRQGWELDDESGRWTLWGPSLPPRGYCGKAGHPHAAQLLEAQMELLQFQLHDHRYGS